MCLITLQTQHYPLSPPGPVALTKRLFCVWWKTITTLLYLSGFLHISKVHFNKLYIWGRSIPVRAVWSHETFSHILLVPSAQPTPLHGRIWRLYLVLINTVQWEVYMSTCFSFPLKANENLSYLSQMDCKSKRDWKACFGWYYAANYCQKNIYFSQRGNAVDSTELLLHGLKIGCLTCGQSCCVMQPKTTFVKNMCVTENRQ